MPLLGKVIYTVNSSVIFWNEEWEEGLKAVMVLAREGATETCIITELAVISEG